MGFDNAMYDTYATVLVLFKDTGGGRTRTGPRGDTHAQRGPGPSKTARRHRPQHRPEQRPKHTRVGPGTTVAYEYRMLPVSIPYEGISERVQCI